MSPLKKYDTFWPRFGAFFIDCIILLPVMWVIFFLIQRANTTLTVVPLLVLNQYAFITYSVLMHARFGQTLGKMATNVKVVDVSERPLSFEQAVMRDLPNLAIRTMALVFGHFWTFEDGVLFFERLMESNNIVFSTIIYGWFGLDVITMVFSEKRRALHDYLADSVVVRILNRAG